MILISCERNIYQLSGLISTRYFSCVMNRESVSINLIEADGHDGNIAGAVAGGSQVSGTCSLHQRASSLRQTRAGETSGQAKETKSGCPNHFSALMTLRASRKAFWGARARKSAAENRSSFLAFWWPTSATVLIFCYPVSLNRLDT